MPTEEWSCTVCMRLIPLDSPNRASVFKWWLLGSPFITVCRECWERMVRNARAVLARREPML